LNITSVMPDAKAKTIPKLVGGNGLAP